MIVNFCYKEGNEEILQIGFDHAGQLYYAQVKSKQTNLVAFFEWLDRDYQRSLELADSIRLN